MDDTASAPAPLPGVASSRLRRRSAICSFATVPFISAIAFESDLGRYEGLYITTLAVILAILLISFMVLALRGIRKEAAEINAGYTTATKVWYDRPYLWAFDAVTLKPAVAPIKPAELGRSGGSQSGLNSSEL